MREREGNVQSSKFTMYSSKIQCVFCISTKITCACVCVCVCTYIYMPACVCTYMYMYMYVVCVSAYTFKKNYSSIM